MAWLHDVVHVLLGLLALRTVARAATPPDCDQALAADCDAARRGGIFACGNCAGAHHHDLQVAGCNATYTEQFCSNQTCVLSAGAFLGGACDEARATDPFSCAKCLGEHTAELNTSRCSVAQQQDYCNFAPCTPPTPPAPAGPAPVKRVTAVLHGCHHVSVRSLTINGKGGGAEATVPVSKPVTFVLTIADSVLGRCTCPTCVTQLFGAIYKYNSSTDQNHAAQSGKCWGSKGSESESWSGSYSLAFTPATTGVYYFKAVQDMQMSCGDATYKHALANFSNWGDGKCDGFGPCGGLARIVVD